MDLRGNLSNEKSIPIHDVAGLNSLEQKVDAFLLKWHDAAPLIKHAIDHMRLFNRAFTLPSIHQEIKDLETELKRIKDEKHASRNGTSS